MIQRQRPPGAVADRVDGRIRGAGGEIDDDAVVAGEPGRARQRIVRCRADTDQHRIARNSGAVRQAHRGDMAVGAFECLHPGVQHDAYTLGRMTALEEIRQRDRCHPGKDARFPLDHHDVGAEDARGRGDLQADIAGADDGDARARARQGPEAIGIGQRAQCDDARKVVAWHGK